LAGYSTPLPELLRQLPPAPPGYELLRRLGSGGMGDVYLAREYPTECLVALKMLRATGNPALAERFIAEVRALRRLKHPNIVQVLATDFLRQQPYYTMAYIEGGTLAERLRHSGPLEPQQAAQLMIPIARAVHAAHCAQVLHRDIKPSNILLDEQGQPHISDFGLAKLLDNSDGLTTLSGPLGTPSYMPPEQCSRRYGPVGPAADIYGLGATLYHMVVGQPPHVGNSAAEIIHHIEQQDPIRPRALRPQIPLELEAIILKCLQKHPQDRYPTAAALADDLERFLHAQKTQAPLLTPWRQTLLCFNRHKVHVLGIMTFVLLIIGLGLALGTVLPKRYQSPESILADIQYQLQQGRPVTLIGPTGVPLWYKNLHGNVTLSCDQTHEGSCVYSSMGYGLMLLLPEVPIDHYHLRAEIRQASLLTARREGLQTGGLFFSYVPDENVEPGSVLHTAKHISFLDHHFAPHNPESYTHPEHVSFGELFLLERPGSSPYLFLRKDRYRHPFSPALTTPGPWHVVEIRAVPDAVAVYWQQEDGTHVCFAEIGHLAMQYSARSTAQSLRGPLPQLQYEPPAWEPRRGLGLWCHRAAYAIRNLTITPIPAPQSQ
jgi:serine/threonine protein kinase